MKRGIVWVVLLSLVGVGGVTSVYGANFNSTNFSINGGLGDSIGGAQSSSNYKLTSVGGESATGATSSPSYKLGHGYIPRLENSMQITSHPVNLVGYWALENVAPGAQVFDQTLFAANPGTYSTGSVSVAGKIGNAWSDSTGNESVTLPDDASYPSGNSMALSMWVQPSSLGTNRAIMTKWDQNTNPTNGEWALQTTSTLSDELRFYVGSNGDSGSNYVDTTNANLTTSMTHIMVLYNGTSSNAQRVRIYVNGAEATTSVTGTIPTSLNGSPTNPITLGDFPGLNRYWRGMIDEVKYFSSHAAVTPQLEYVATNAGVPASLSLGSNTPGSPLTLEAYVNVWTDSPYTLSINQNADLNNGAASIPGVSGTIAAPVLWVDGTTKGLGFSLSAGPIGEDPLWNSGNSYAAIPNTATSFYTRTGYNGGTNDFFYLRFKVDTTTSQQSGNYTNQVTYTGTMLP